MEKSPDTGNHSADSNTESAQPNREPHPEASGHRPQAEGQGLNVPVPGNGTGTSAQAQPLSPEPVFMRIPIEKLWPNPKNPRRFIRPGAVEAKIKSMREIGQKDPIKVWRLSEAEKAEIGGLFEFGIVGGHLRREAALRLGWKTLDALVYDLEPVQILINGFMDNEEEDPHWLDRYLTIEEISRAQPGVSQVVIADQIESDQPTVSRALKLVEMLNDKAKTAIYGNSENTPKTLKNEGGYGNPITMSNLKGIPENLVFLLLDLEKAAKNTPEARDLIAKALILVGKRDMTESKVRELVNWVLAGKPMADFGRKARSKAKGTVESPAPETLAPIEGVTQTPVSTGEAPAPSAHPAAPVAPQSPESLGETNPSTMLGAGPSTKPVGSSVEPPKLQPEVSAKGPNFIDEVLAGVSVIQPIRAKVKAGEAVSKRERLFLLACFVWGFLKWAWKASRPIRHGFLKVLHNIGKGPAKFFYPLHHSKSSGSGNLNQGIDRLIELLGHGAVYVFCQIAFLEAVIGLISIPFPGLKPWLEWLPRLAVHEGLVVFPAWALAYGKANLIPGVIFLFLGIFLLAYAAAKNPMPIILLVCFLGLAGYYGRNWGEIPPPWKASAPRSQIEGQALSAPIPKQGIGDDTSKPQVVTAPPAMPAPIEVKTLPPSPKKTKIKDEPRTLTSVPRKPESVEGPSPAAQAEKPTDIPEARPLLVSEASSVDDNTIIKSKLVTPDPQMIGAMAISRISDLQSADDYSLMIGHDKNRMVAVVPSALGLSVQYQGGGLPLGGILGDNASKVVFYWEDVQAIYCDELDGNNGVIYQCAVVAKGLKRPFVVQCASEDDMTHMVSALDYFVRTVKGQNAPQSGMPYLNQGMILGDENKITALWAGSPAEKSQLHLGDHLWSVNSEKRMQKAELESALEALPPGRQDVEAVIPKDWDAEVEKEARLKSKAFHPFVLDFELVVP